MIFIRVEALQGTEIVQAIDECMSLSGLLSVTVLLKFNQRPVYISPGDSFDDIRARWEGKCLPPDNLPGLEPEDDSPPPIDGVLRIVAGLYNLDPADLKQRTRESLATEARQVAMYLLYMTNKYTLDQIGRGIGGRTPATAHHAFNKIATRIKKNARLKLRVERAQKLISGR